MTLQLYNTATRRKEPFTPREPGKVGLYVCGVTVYDLCHIGHARSAIVFDVLVRYLRAKGLEVTYVRNFTDVDDKIIDRAAQLGEDPGVLAQRFIDAFYEDMGRLGVLEADIEPRATEHVEGMIAMIEALLEKGLAYAVDGDVFYSVEAFQGYGALSGRKLEDMKAGSRIAVDEKKRHPMDFALWKSAKPGEPQWSSPWGPGRPGWHLECSVMSNRYLGPSFDIHGGGRDLLFPHHENERAQSIGANGGEFARYWVHNGFVTVEGEKMSKSLGNFLTIRDAVEQYHPQVLRLFLLSKHYRSPLDFSKGAVLGQQSGLVRIYRTLKRLEEEAGPPEGLPDFGTLAEGQQDDTTFLGAFVHAMDDDLNTAGAIGILFEKVRDLNRILDAGPAENRVEQLQTGRGELLAAASVLGLLETPPDVFFDEMAGRGLSADRSEIDALVEERMQARAGKDWAKADRIRDRLKEMGVVLEDGPGGTTWRLDV
ncbi:cysteine--tRNA ligase [Desulfatiglans anilini]|uniref:cysteine--tRNA ligase n=1 Tax=Desulfatiglans anilini TaxID=90728 RepID=UPI0003F99513|nr:cysteine--tRNA ligase [Desulfatiglans anilini]